jgi:small subunit ribosomal protein S16
MAVMIRLKRMGRANRPFWRICATDKRFARDGRVLEELGHYDPLLGDQDKVKIHRDRVVHWLKAGARPSDTVGQFLSHLGLDVAGNEIPPKPWRKKKAPPPAALRIAAQKKKAEEAAAAKAAETAKAAEAEAARAAKAEKKNAAEAKAAEAKAAAAKAAEAKPAEAAAPEAAAAPKKDEEQK